MLMADIIKDYSLTVMIKQEDPVLKNLPSLFYDLEQQGKHDLLSENVEEGHIFLERFLDMRYEGQSYEIIVPFSDDYLEAFHAHHEKKYGYRNSKKRIEVVNLRTRARGLPEKPVLKRHRLSSEKPSQKAYLGKRKAIFENRPVETPILMREKLASGNKFEGPAVVVEYSSTIVVPPFAEASVDEYGNVVMEINH
jgi:N-methylhydantoinase A